MLLKKIKFLSFISLIIIFVISKSLFASNLPRNLQGVFLGSKVSDIPIFLGCSKKFFDVDKKIVAKIKQVNAYLCFKNKFEVLTFLTKSNSESIIGIIQIPSLLKIFSTMSSPKSKLDNKEYKNEIIKKYGVGKISKFLNSEKTMIWEDKKTVLSVDDFGITGLVDYEYFKFLNSNITSEEINKVFGDFEEKTNTNISRDKKFIDEMMQQFKKKKQTVPLTIKEIEQIQNHIKKCWKVPYGLDDFRDNITLKISINTEMQVMSVVIRDKEKYIKSKKYRALADSARRAVLDCPQLPINKKFYSTLKNFTMDFNAF